MKLRLISFYSPFMALAFGLAFLISGLFGQVKAISTGDVMLDNVVSSAYMISPENATQSGSFTEPTGSGSPTLTLNKNGGFGIPDEAVIEYYDVKVYGNSKNLLAKTLDVDLKSPSADCIVADADEPMTRFASGVSGLTVTESHVFNACGESFTSTSIPNEYTVKIIYGNTYSYEIDYVTVNITYHLAHATFEYTELSSSPSAGIRKLLITGDMATTSATMRCNVYVGEVCPDEVPPINNQKLLTIKLNANYPLTVSNRMNDGLYEGAWYSPTSSTFSAVINVPYRSRSMCTYPQSYECYEVVDGAFVLVDAQSYFDNFTDGSWEGSYFTHNDNLYSNLNAGSIELLADCSEGDWWCGQMNKLMDWIWNVIKPQTLFDSSDFTEKKNQLMTKAPFAYINAILNISTTNPATSSALPISSYNTYMFKDDETINITYNAPSVLTNNLSQIRGYITILLYASTVLFMLNKVRQITSE